MSLLYMQHLMITIKSKQCSVNFSYSYECFYRIINISQLSTLLIRSARVVTKETGQFLNFCLSHESGRCGKFQRYNLGGSS